MTSCKMETFLKMLFITTVLFFEANNATVMYPFPPQDSPFPGQCSHEDCNVSCYFDYVKVTFNNSSYENHTKLRLENISFPLESSGDCSSRYDEEKQQSVLDLDLYSCNFFRQYVGEGARIYNTLFLQRFPRFRSRFDEKVTISCLYELWGRKKSSTRATSADRVSSTPMTATARRYCSAVDSSCCQSSRISAQKVKLFPDEPHQPLGPIVLKKVNCTRFNEASSQWQKIVDQRGCPIVKLPANMIAGLKCKVIHCFPLTQDCAAFTDPGCKKIEGSPPTISTFLPHTVNIRYNKTTASVIKVLQTPIEFPLYGSIIMKYVNCKLENKTSSIWKRFMADEGSYPSEKLTIDESKTHAYLLFQSQSIPKLEELLHCDIAVCYPWTEDCNAFLKEGIRVSKLNLSLKNLDPKIKKKQKKH